MMSSLTTAATPSAWVDGAAAAAEPGMAAPAAVWAAAAAGSAPVMSDGSSTLGAVMREGGAAGARDWARAAAEASRGSVRAAAASKAPRRGSVDMENVDPVFTTVYLKSGRWYPVLPNVTSRRRSMMVSEGRRVRL